MFLADARRKRTRSSLSSSVRGGGYSNEQASSSSSSLRRRLSTEWVDVPPSSSQGDALQGVIICVTGLSPESKSHCHELVEELGGSFTRHLDSSQNTHLIALVPDGPKYEAAMSCPNMFVVKPTWLEACYQTKSRVSEKEHSLKPTTTCNKEEEKKLQAYDSVSLPKALSQLLQSASFQDRVFSSCMLLLIGFSDDSEERFQLGQLIRKGWGTIYWEMNDSISHIIVADRCDESIRNAVRAATLQHPNRPSVVSPWWVLASWQAERLASAEAYPPKRSNQLEKPIKAQQPSQSKTKSRTQKKTPKSSALFRGCLFVLLRMAPPANAVDFDVTELEETIRWNGGQLLSLKLVEALRADAAQQKLEQRSCYVVCWGGFHAPTQMSLHPLLAQVKRFQLANLQDVTPIWLRTCVADQRKYAAHSLPSLFQPQSWPLRRLLLEEKLKPPENQPRKEVKISITGFLTPERTAIIQLIQDVGAIYDDTMRTTTTHLLCREGGTAPVGLKVRKALQWGLHVLSVEWLYHVAQYGYPGQDKCSQGCEGRFSLANQILKENPGTVQDVNDADESQEVAGTQEENNIT